MALIDVPHKNADGNLDNEEFNQFLDALKIAAKGINTLDIQSSTGKFTGLVEFAGDVLIGGQSGPFEQLWSSSNVIYVGKNGLGYDPITADGKTPGKAILTFQDAIDNAATIHGGVIDSDNPITIICLDGGLYEGAISCLDYVDIIAPSASIKLGGVGSKQLVIRNNQVMVGRILRETGTNDMVTTAASMGRSSLKVAIIQDEGTGTAVSVTTPIVAYIEIDQLKILGGGVGLGDDSASSSHIHLRIHSVQLSSTNAIGINKNQPGTMHGFVDGISYGTAVVSNTTAIVQTNGTVSLSLIELKGHNAYNIASPAILNLYSNKVQGIELGNGIIDVVTPEKINDAIDDIDGKEDDLGLPPINGQALTSTTLGVRSWATYGDMTKAIYDPESVTGDAFRHENHNGVYFDLALGESDPALQEGRLSWNDAENTLNVNTGLGETIIQVGQELLIRVHNGTAGTLANGKVVYMTNVMTSGVPNCDYAIANDSTKLQSFLAVLTDNILTGEDGFATIRGKVRGINTSLLAEGTLWLSDTVAGNMIDTPPAFPSYAIEVAGNLVSGVDGIVFADIAGDLNSTFHNFWNGTVRENFDFIVESNGTIVNGTLERTGGGDLTMILSDGFTILDCTSVTLSINLTPGTNTDPVKNYIYIPITTKVLTVSTTDWPVGEHIRIADVVLQSAANTGNYGQLSNRNWNDHVQGTDGQGDLSHIGAWIRNRPAAWYSGAEGTVTVVAADEVYFSNTSGKIFQKHLQTFDTHNQQTGDPVFVVNDPITPYKISNNLTNELLDSNGTTMSTNFYNIVIWGVNNKGGQADQIMMNLPGGSYAALDSALTDIGNFDNYNIPTIYNGSGFLIARFTLKHSNPAVWTLENTTDLRGTIAGGGGGGVGGGGASEFTTLSDTPSSYIGNAGDILKVNAGESALEFISGASGSFTSNDGKTITVTNGIITAIV